MTYHGHELHHLNLFQSLVSGSAASWTMKYAFVMSYLLDSPITQWDNLVSDPLHLFLFLFKQRANRSFEVELSTLNQSDKKKLKEHKPFSAQITQKQGLSSRQTPFKSPNHLSANISNQQQTNGEKQGIHASNSSSHPSDKDVSCLSTKK